MGLETTVVQMDFLDIVEFLATLKIEDGDRNREEEIQR